MEITIFFLISLHCHCHRGDTNTKEDKRRMLQESCLSFKHMVRRCLGKKGFRSNSAFQIILHHFFFGTCFSPLLLLQSYQEKSSALPCPQIVLCASLCSQGNNFDALPPTRSVSLAHLVLSHRHQKSTLPALSSTQYVLSTSQ